MKERPILFSAPMVRAILAGQKNQTRRILKNTGLYAIEPHHGAETAARERAALATQCPYGQPGDRLWVRETFQPLFADGVENHWETDWKTGKGYKISYPATDGIQEFIDLDDGLSDACKPSIHMPRWASRILLEITGVRVERLQDMSEGDAKAEGLHYDDEIPFNGPWFIGTAEPDGFANPVDAYRELWECINGPGSWDANPLVWVVEFKHLNGSATATCSKCSTPDMCDEFGCACELAEREKGGAA